MKRTRAILASGLAWACATPAPVMPTDTTPPPATSEAEAPTENPVPPPSQSLSRWVPSDEFQDIGDERTGAAFANRRIVVKGAQASVIDSKPIDDLGRPQRIPEPLGGGFLFVGKHTVRFSTRFDGPLDTIATLPPSEEMLEIGVGHGRILVLGEKAPPELRALPIRGGTPAFFGCNAQKKMALFRIDAVDKPFVLEKQFKDIYTHDFEPAPNAPLALARRCDGSGSPGTLCVRRKDATWKELPKVPDPPKLLAKVPMFVHVAASADGSAYAFGWLDGGGDLIVVDSKQNKVRRIAKSSFPEPALHARTWDAFNVVDGKLRFLFATNKRRESPGILDIRADDGVEAKELKGRLAAAGKRALHVTERGTLEETLDAGVTFHEIPLPPGGATDSGPFACFETGCSLGPWRRVGWGP